MTNWMAGLPAIRRAMFWYAEKNGNIEILPLTIWLVEADDGRNQRRPTRDPERDSIAIAASPGVKHCLLKAKRILECLLTSNPRTRKRCRRISTNFRMHGRGPCWHPAILHEVNVAEKIWRRKISKKLHYSGVSPVEVKNTNKAPFSERFWTLWDVRKATFNIQNDHQKYNSTDYLRFKRCAFVWFYLMPEVCGGEEFSSNYVRLMT